MSRMHLIPILKLRGKVLYRSRRLKDTIKITDVKGTALEIEQKNGWITIYVANDLADNLQP